ncbi:rho guanine nucleotide exchange factor 39 [Gadus macrocephalus]|uniref:rho guanine nucleotide exchange factor 39 n=1 Tax=Gadus macrocephalus TaxID=80720 RepID=UPI0028CB82F1|nr:rho guanine nucleotide exchange factor 39 [Gadus macrocephalus]
MSFSPGVSDPSGASVIQEQRDRWARKRSRVARELVLTEQRYCQQLELVNTYFVEILKAKETLRPSVVESVFSSIKAIHSVNQSLLVHVENGYLGRGFEQFCPHLPHYNVYVDNMYDARKVLAVREPPRTGCTHFGGAIWLQSATIIKKCPKAKSFNTDPSTQIKTRRGLNVETLLARQRNAVSL